MSEPEYTAGAESVITVCFISIIVGVILGAVALYTGLSLNNRVDRQRDFLCAKYADADATLRDCPKDTLPERIKALE